MREGDTSQMSGGKYIAGRKIGNIEIRIFFLSHDIILLMKEGGVGGEWLVIRVVNRFVFRFPIVFCFVFRSFFQKNENVNIPPTRN